MAAILPLQLPDHLHTLLISTIGFAAVHHLIAPEFAQFILGKKAWDALGTRQRVGWCVFLPLFLLCVESLVRVLTGKGYMIGKRVWPRSFTRCSFSRSPRAVSISLRLRRIARLDGNRAQARSLPSRAGKSGLSQHMRHRSLTSTRLADTSCGIRSCVWSITKGGDF
jgi:hypothetical protein